MNPHSDTLTTADGRTALRMERRLAHPPQRVWDAITQPAHLAQWFPSEVSVELRPGGAMGFSFPGAGEPGMTGTVTEAEEPRVFAFTWGEDHLRWEITPEGEGSLLTLVHTFGDRFGAASFASGWHLCITALEQLLDGEKVDVGRDRGELHEAYLEQFDLGRGIVEYTADGLADPLRTAAGAARGDGLGGTDRRHGGVGGCAGPGGLHGPQDPTGPGHRGTATGPARLRLGPGGRGPLATRRGHGPRPPPDPDPDRPAGHGRG